MQPRGRPERGQGAAPGPRPVPRRRPQRPGRAVRPVPRRRARSRATRPAGSATRSAVQGREGDVGVLWDYYLVASPDGDQLLATFTLAADQAQGVRRPGPPPDRLAPLARPGRRPRSPDCRRRGIPRPGRRRSGERSRHGGRCPSGPEDRSMRQGRAIVRAGGGDRGRSWRSTAAVVLWPAATGLAVGRPATPRRGPPPAETRPVGDLTTRYRSSRVTPRLRQGRGPDDRPVPGGDPRDDPGRQRQRPGGARAAGVRRADALHRAARAGHRPGGDGRGPALRGVPAQPRPAGQALGPSPA